MYNNQEAHDEWLVASSLIFNSLFVKAARLLLESKPRLSAASAALQHFFQYWEECGSAMFPPQGSNFLGATAPPASMFDNVPGYEGTAMGGGGGYLPPPAPAYPPPAPEPSPTQPEWNIPSISEDTAREAFRLFVSNHCCWCNGPAKDGMITAMDSFNTYRVKAGSVKQEFEKQEELRRSAMRAVAALLSIAEAQKSPAMADFASQIRSCAEMSSIFESIQRDTSSSACGPTDAMDTS